MPVGMWAKASVSPDLPRRAVAKALMLPFLAVERSQAPTPGLGLGEAGIGVQVDLLVFQASPQPLGKVLSMHRPPAFARLRGGRLWSGGFLPKNRFRPFNGPIFR